LPRGTQARLRVTAAPRPIRWEKRMTRRDRRMRTLRGEPVDRPPVSFYEINGLDERHKDRDPLKRLTSGSCPRRETGFDLHEGRYNAGDEEYTVFACVKRG
jgi:hypothetical protein